jgi:hypothetical protein
MASNKRRPYNMGGHVLRKIIGIDALKLVGFSIEIVNEEKFHEAERMKIIEIEYRKKPNVISGIHIVNDKLFKSLRWEKKETEYRKYEISALELTVSNNGNNLNPMLVNEVNARLETINYHLVNDMGIIMRTEGFYINSMEININVCAPKKFSELLPLYKKLIANIPYFNKSYQESGNLIHLKNKDVTSCSTAYECYKNGRTIKGSIICYNKSEDLSRKKIMDLHDNIVRFELKAGKSRTVKRIYGTAKWNDLSDEKIYQAYFSNVIKPIHNYVENIYSPYCLSLGKKLIMKHKNRNIAWMLSMMKEIEQLNKRDIPVLLDWQDLLPAFKELNKHRHINRIRGPLEKAATDTSVGQEYRKCLDILLHEIDEIYNHGVVNYEIRDIR